MLQRTPEWFAKRAGKFTSSRAADLMARTKTGPSASRGALIVTLGIERVLGTCVETYQNAAMQRGIELEPEALQFYENHALQLVTRVDYVEMTGWPHIGCSPDGYLGIDGLIEIKCPANPNKHYEALLKGAHAVEYHWQLQHQLMVTGRRYVEMVSYDPRFPRHKRLAITRVERDDKVIGELFEACQKAEKEVLKVVENLV
jgi:putative phage-type endonuclease